MFFSFEGIDGSGKSTQARLLAQALRQRDYEVVEVREPGGTPLGERVRSLLLDPDAIICARAELLLFAAARAQLVSSVIAPALDRGAVVIADRFTDSSEAYQGGGRTLSDGPSTLSVTELNQFATHTITPRRTYLVDVSLEQAAERRGQRELTDRMESDGPAFFERVRMTYLSLAQAHGQRIRVVDGRDSIQSIHKVILTDALSYIDHST